MKRALFRRMLSDHKVRFVLVGATNTVLGFSLYSLGLLVFDGVKFGYLLSLGISYAIAISVAFVLYRRFVFIVRGNLLVDYVRFVSVYVAAIAVNAVGLALLVEFASVQPLFGQLVMLVVTTVLSYVGHRWFSFRRPQLSTATGTDTRAGAVDQGAGGNE